MEAILAGNVAAVFQVMSNELKTPKILNCPTDEKRIQATTFDRSDLSIGKSGGTFFGGNTNLSYFVGVDAKDTSIDMFLSGDDNFLVNDVPTKSSVVSLTTNTPVAWGNTRHEKQGNIVRTDGSVEYLSSSALRKALSNTGLETNRLAMP